MTTVATRDLLASLGFEEGEGRFTDGDPNYFFDFGNMRLEAAQFALAPSFMAPHFQFSGIWGTTRVLASVDFRLPLTVESLEVGTATIAHHIGDDFVPSVATPWLDRGRALREHLSWERSRRAYEARPLCWVEREWFRMVAKTFRSLAADAQTHDLATFSFDGQVLKMRTGESLLVAPATGTAWQSSYDVALHELQSLPKRMMRDPVGVDVWEDRLKISGRSFSILSQPSLDDSEK